MKRGLASHPALVSARPRENINGRMRKKERKKAGTDRHLPHLEIDNCLLCTANWVISLCTGELIRGLMIGKMGLNNKKHDDLSLWCCCLCHLSYPTFDCHAWELLLSSISAYLALIKWFSTEQLMGPRCKNGPALRRAPAVHCCKSQSHYTGDELWENMAQKIPPCLSPGCFLLQHTMHCTCSIFSLLVLSESFSTASQLRSSFKKNTIVYLSLFYSFPFAMLDEVVTCRSFIQYQH